MFGDVALSGVTEPDYEPLTEQEASGVLAATLAKLDSDATAGSGADTAGGADGKSRVVGVRSRRTGSRGRGKHGRRILLIAAAVVLAFSAVAFAAGNIDPDSPLLAFFGRESGSLSEDETKLALSGGTVIDKVIEKNGVKVHVKEAIGDRDTVYLLVDVTPPEDISKPGEHYTFDRIVLREKTLLPGGGNSSFSSSELSADGTIPFIINAGSDGGVQGKTFTLELHDLIRLVDAEEQAGKAAAANVATDSEGQVKAETAASKGSEIYSYSSSEPGSESDGVFEYGLVTEENGENVEYHLKKDADGNVVEYTSGPAASTEITERLIGDDLIDEVAVNGTWKVTFKLDYADNSKDLGVNADISVDGETYRLKDVRVSPLSLSYTVIDGEPQPPGVEADSAEDNMKLLEDTDLIPVTIKFKDGSTRDVEYTEGSWSGNGNEFTHNIIFPHIIDPAQIESIAIGGHEAAL
jgi:hypothetical protein